MENENIQRESLLCLVLQAKEIIENVINIYKFSLQEMDDSEEVDFLLIAKEKYKCLQLQSSYHTLGMYEFNLKQSSLIPVLLVPDLYSDFLIWIKNIEKICLENIESIPNNVFEKIYSESYSEIYCSPQLNKLSKDKEIVNLIDEEDEEDDW